MAIVLTKKSGEPEKEVQASAKWHLKPQCD
jgi:hypothetical protein